MKDSHFTLLMVVLGLLLALLIFAHCGTIKSTQTVTVGASIQVQVKRTVEVRDTIK